MKVKKNKKDVKKNEEKIIDKINDKLNKKTDFRIYELILFGILIACVSVFLTFVISHNTNRDNDLNKINNNVSQNSKLSEFNEIYSLIKNSYYEKTDDTKLIDGAINGMLSSLEDPHTSYFNKEQTEQFDSVMNGSYEGIGAELTINSDNNIIITKVFKNSPANEVGLKPNDIILEVNGVSTEGKTTTEVVALIKDSSKKTAKIKINRNGKAIDFEVEKRVVEIDSVEYKIYDTKNKQIGYVNINTFANNTYAQFREAIEKMEENNIKGLVIDVRGNSGGYLHSVTSMLDMFFDKDTIIYQIQDRSKTTKYTASTTESRNYPVVVLTDGLSASASEILAVALKEAYAADIVGTVTYGKGTVQTTKDLSSGGMIKYTIQKWLSPKGNWINEKGVEPTTKVELSNEYMENPIEENDNQLKKALDIISNK